MADALILTGPPGAGKSSVAEALAERYDRVAHIKVDALRHFVTPTGFAGPGRKGFEHQKGLATRNACDLARNFLAERFAVIIDDVVVTSGDLDAYMDCLADCQAPIHFIRLLPSLEVCNQRNLARPDGRVSGERLERVYSQFVKSDISQGALIDSSNQSLEETTDGVQALTTSGASLVWTPS